MNAKPPHAPPAEPSTHDTTAPRPWASIRSGLFAALISSALLVVSTPPYSVWWIALFAAIPMLYVAESWASKRRAYHANTEANRHANHPGALWALSLGVTLGLLPWWLWSHWWIGNMTAAGYPLLALALSICGGVSIGLIAWIRWHIPRLPLALVAAIIWVAVEGFRGEIFFHGYCWSLIGHSFIDGPAWLSQPASVLGAYFISFFNIFLQAGTTRAFVERFHGPQRPARVHLITLTLGMASFLAVGFIGRSWSRQHVATTTPTPPTITVGLVQTNIPQSTKLNWSIENEIDDFERFKQLTLVAANSKPRPDLIVWPETMMPGPGLDPDLLSALAKNDVFFTLSVVRESGPKKIWATSFADALLDLQKELNIPMLVGAEGIDKGRVVDVDNKILIDGDARYNSVFHLRNGRVNPERYDKLRLTPFGEEMPYIQSWPWLNKKLIDLGAGGMKFDLAEGKRPKVHDVHINSLNREIAIATPICYEVADATVCHRLVYQRGKRKADLLVSVTNDGWFFSSDMARLQHLVSARWRCVELGTPMARVANTGISAIINAQGQVLAQGATPVSTDPAQPFDPNSNPILTRTDGVLVGDVPLATAPTLYGQIGRLQLPGPLGRPVNCDSFAALTMFAGLTLTAAGVVKSRRPRR